MFELSSSQLKGRITELEVVNAFIKLGYNISEPYVADRYDFIADVNGHLLKIQVKTASEKEGKIIFATRNTHINTQGKVYKNYKDDNIDLFATIYNDKCYLVPVAECGVSTCTLRITPTLSGKKQGIRFLEDYEIEKILKSYI